MRTTRGLLALALLLLCAGFPAQALGQSAGDEQYTDPFGGQQNSNGGGGGQQGGSSGGQNGGDPGDVPVDDDGSGSASPDSTAAPGAEASDGTDGTYDDSGALPNTGLPVGVLLALGAGLLLSGLALRRKA